MVRALVDVVHQLHLSCFFGIISLVDANRVNPKRAKWWLSRQFSKRVVEPVGYTNLMIVDRDRPAAQCVAPDV